MSIRLKIFAVTVLLLMVFAVTTLVSALFIKRLIAELEGITDYRSSSTWWPSWTWRRSSTS
jgi:hypothetical protein